MELAPRARLAARTTRRGARAGDGPEARGDQRAEFVRRHRPREEEALRLLAAERAQERGLRVELDALGNLVEAERVRHVDDGADDGGVVLVVHDVCDERAVDLERGERE